MLCSILVWQNSFIDSTCPSYPPLMCPLPLMYQRDLLKKGCGRTWQKWRMKTKKRSHLSEMITAETSSKAASYRTSKVPVLSTQIRKTEAKRLKTSTKQISCYKIEFILGSEMSNLNYSFKLLQLTESRSCRGGSPHVPLEVAPLFSTDQQL